MGCTNCGCSTSSHINIGGGSYHCKNCGRHCKWVFSSGKSYCYICEGRFKNNSEDNANYINELIRKIN